MKRSQDSKKFLIRINQTEKVDFNNIHYRDKITTIHANGLFLEFKTGLDRYTIIVVSEFVPTCYCIVKKNLSDARLLI